MSLRWYFGGHTDRGQLPRRSQLKRSSDLVMLEPVQRREGGGIQCAETTSVKAMAPARAGRITLITNKFSKMHFRVSYKLWDNGQI